MKRIFLAGAILFLIGHLVACNSDVPVTAVTEVVQRGYAVAITRVATHPFLARFNLKVEIRTNSGCSASSELFPDTGGVSRRNLYLDSSDRLYIIGQFDVRRFDPSQCLLELIEFRSLESGLTYIGSFDTEPNQEWAYFSVSSRPEKPFEKL